MLNLLPQQHKEKVRGEYLRRFFVVAVLFFSLVCVFFGVAIFPAFTLTKVRSEIAELNLVNIKSSALTKDKDAVLSTIKDLENKMKVIGLISGEKATDYIDKALTLKTKGISIKSITYSKKEDSRKEIVIEGLALTRADLVFFSKTIKASSWISSDVPLSNLANERNIPFSIILTASSTAK